MYNSILNDVFIKQTNSTDFTLSEPFRHCKAHTRVHVSGAVFLYSYSTLVCVKLGNLYLVEDQFCTATTWQHVNKFIGDTVDKTDKYAIVYLNGTRSDKLGIYAYNPLHTHFQDIIHRVKYNTDKYNSVFSVAELSYMFTTGRAEEYAKDVIWRANH